MNNHARYGPIFGQNEAHRFQEAFQMRPGPLGYHNKKRKPWNSEQTKRKEKSGNPEQNEEIRKSYLYIYISYGYIYIY